MDWNDRRERDARQEVMFDLMLGDVVAPLDRVAPSDCRRCRGTGSAPSTVEIAARAGAVCPCGDCGGTGHS